MDALTQVLKVLRLQPSAFHHLKLESPWGMQLAAINGAAFHVVEEGQCWLRLGDILRPLKQGDIIVVSNTASYELVADAESPVLMLDQVLSHRGEDGYIRLGTEQTGLYTSLLCSYFRTEQNAPFPLFSILPPLIYIPGSAGRAIDWLAAPLELVAFEADHAYPGKETVISRIMDILLIMVIRHWIVHQQDTNGGWLNALYHPLIGEVLGYMHRQPELSWTVESLAAAVHMSRSSLANQFTLLVGEAPMKYLTRWRMQLAASHLLDDPAATVEQVALGVGYASPYAFSKTFKRWLGLSPTDYRQVHIKTPSTKV